MIAKIRWVLVVIIVLTAKMTEAQNSRVYSNENYSINYPDTWRMDTTRQIMGAIFFFSPLEDSVDNFDENVNVMIQDLRGKNINLSAYKKISEDQLSTMQIKGRILKSAIEKVPGGELYDFEYLATMNGYDLHIKSLCKIKNEKACLATFTAKADTFESYNSVASQMLASLKMK